MGTTKSLNMKLQYSLPSESSFSRSAFSSFPCFSSFSKTEFRYIIWCIILKCIEKAFVFKHMIHLYILAYKKKWYSVIPLLAILLQSTKKIPYMDANTRWHKFGFNLWNSVYCDLSKHSSKHYERRLSNWQIYEMNW